MFSIKKICSWMFVLGLAMLIPSVKYLKLTDELISVFLLVLIGLDCVVNGRWRRYKAVWILMGIFAFYVLYSIAFMHYNTTACILMDSVLELKPFLPFLVIYIVVPTFDSTQKKWIRAISIVNCVIAIAIMIPGYKFAGLVINHVAYCGATVLISLLAYIMVSRDENGALSRRQIQMITIFLLLGCICTRSKYYGEVVIMLFCMYVYRPGMFRKLNYKHALAVTLLVIVFVGVAWSKFEYYFLKGNSDTIDITTMESFARPVLYVTGLMIMVNSFPFGSGLASFASYPSQVNYSSLYYEYGIDKVWGLSPSMPDFICDAYYPLLAQFGIVGLGLFIAFYRWVYKLILGLLKCNPVKYKYDFIVGVMVLVFVLVESVAGTLIVQVPGVIAMMLAGFVCGEYREIRNNNKTDNIS